MKSREDFNNWPHPCCMKSREDLNNWPHPCCMKSREELNNWLHPCCMKSNEDLNNRPHPCCMRTMKAFPTVFDFLARQGGRSPCWSHFCLHWVDGHTLSIGLHHSRPWFVRARINLTNEPFCSTLAFPHKRGVRWGTMLLHSWCF